MADLDNRAKRASAIGIDLIWTRIYPNPDGTLDVNDRQQIGMKYAGTLGVSTISVSVYRTLMGVGG